MARLAEGDLSLLGYRLATPNRYRCQVSHHHLVKAPDSEESAQGRTSKVSIREVPSVPDIVKATRGVNSRSAQISLGFFDVINFTAELPQNF